MLAERPPQLLKILPVLESVQRMNPASPPHRRSRCYTALGTMPAVNPKILVWARETAGLTLQDAVAKVGIKDAYGVAAVDRLALLERGQTEPTRPVLVRMAQHYRRPLLAFYLAAPPPRGDRVADFRTLPEADSPGRDALVDALIRNLRCRQSMLRASLVAEEEAESLPFVGAVSRSVGGKTAKASLDNILGRIPEAARLSQLALRTLSDVLGDDLDAAMYYAQPTPEEAFGLLRSRTEDARVFVLLKGDLGSHHTAIDVEVFRGLAIADNVAPFVVINDNDSRAAWSFTLLHELTHLLLGQTGISGSHPGTTIEKFCNNVAAEWLLPLPTLDQIEIDGNLIELRQRIGEFAWSRNLSGTMVSYRLLRANRIDQPIFENLQAYFREQWWLQRDRQRTKERESAGGPNYFAVRRHRVGEGLLRFARQSMGSGALSTTKIAKILDVKPAQVGKMLRPARTR